MEFVLLVQHVENRLHARFGFQWCVEQVLRVADAKINRLWIGCRVDGDKKTPRRTEETAREEPRGTGCS